MARSSFSVSTIINADRAKVWDVLANIGEIHRWNPGVLHSKVTGDLRSGLAAKRLCELPGKRFLDEEVVVWEPQQRLTMRIVDSNLPFRSADIQFELTHGPDEASTQVTVSPEYQLKFGSLGQLLNGLIVGPAYKKGMKDLLLGLKRYLEHEAGATVVAPT